MAGEDRTQQRVVTAPDVNPPPAEQLPAIAGFEMKTRLGEGGMATVYLAVDPSLGRLVAIKMMSTELSRDPAFRTRFENEARTVARFRHPNIVSVHASGEVDGAKYIVMEYVEGGTLSDKLASGKLEAGEACDIARHMAGALAYSHSRGIIHRDFKPANILFTGDGMPVLSDFGVAKSTTPEETKLTQLGMVVGSLRYMAPEQARGGEITERIDIYSLGVVLFEMLTGDVPPCPISDDKEEKWVRAALDEYPPELVDLICRCLRKDAAERPSAEQCHQALARIAHPTRLPRHGRRRAVIVAGAGVVIGGLTAAALYTGLPSLSSNDPARSFGGGPASEAALVAYAFDTEPASALVYVDGMRVTGGTADLSAGRHEVAAVAPGYYGEIRTLEAGVEPGDVTIALEPIELPSSDELNRFVSALGAPRAMRADLENIDDAALKSVLDLKQLSAAGRAEELAELERDLETLVSFDDQAAAVTLYLAAESGYLARDSAGLVPRLQTAMDSGYALATFWYAIRLRDALTSVQFGPDDPSYRLYCNTMALAYEQGLDDIANRYLRDDCQSPR